MKKIMLLTYKEIKVEKEALRRLEEEYDGQCFNNYCNIPINELMPISVSEVGPDSPLPFTNEFFRILAGNDIIIFDYDRNNKEDYSKCLFMMNYINSFNHMCSVMGINKTIYAYLAYDRKMKMDDIYTFSKRLVTTEKKEYCEQPLLNRYYGKTGNTEPEKFNRFR